MLQWESIQYDAGIEGSGGLPKETTSKLRQLVSSLWQTPWPKATWGGRVSYPVGWSPLSRELRPTCLGMLPPSVSSALLPQLAMKTKLTNNRDRGTDNLKMVSSLKIISRSNCILNILIVLFSPAEIRESQEDWVSTAPSEMHTVSEFRGQELSLNRIREGLHESFLSLLIVNLYCLDKVMYI